VAWVDVDERAVHGYEQELDDVDGEDEREYGRDQHGGRRDHQSIAELDQVLDERELFVALGGHRT